MLCRPSRAWLLSYVTLPGLGYASFIKEYLFILAPTLDADIIQLDIAESIYECRRKTTVGDKGNIKVDGGTTYLITVGELTGSEVLRDVHHHIDLMVVEHVESLWLTVL